MRTAVKITMYSLTPLAPLSEVIAKRRKRALIQAENRRLLYSILRMVVGLGIVVGIFLMLFSFHIVEGNDMYPALCDGDLVLTYDKSEYVKNDIVFYEANGGLHCGRVVAKGGDSVGFADDKLYVNGTAQTTDIVFSTSAPASWSGTVKVPEDSIYVLGDYRTACVDSRTFGFIPLENVKSKVIVLLRHKTL